MKGNSRSDMRTSARHEPSAQSNRADEPTVLMAAIAAATIGALMYNLLPIFLGSIEVSKALASSQTGLIGTAFFVGFNIAGISAFAWIRRFHWRTVSLLSMPCLFAALFVCVQVTTFPALLVGTAACGIAFGINYTIGSVIIGDTSRPERWYGMKVGLESVAGAIVLVTLPFTPAAQQGFAGTASAMALIIALLLPLLFFLPNVWNKDTEADINPDNVTQKHFDLRPINRLAIGSAVLSLLALFASVSAIWAFAERMGELTGFTKANVDMLLAVTLISGIAGSIVVAILASRLNTVIAFVATIFLIIVALVCLSVKGSFLFYAIGNCLYMFAWAAGTPLAMAEISRLDLDGRYVSLIAPAIGIGGMVGPGIAGWLLEIADITAVLMYVATTILASGVLMLLAAWFGRLPKSERKVEL